MLARSKVRLEPKHLLSKLPFVFFSIQSLWCRTVNRNVEEAVGYVDSAIIPRE